MAVYAEVFYMIENLSATFCIWYSMTVQVVGFFISNFAFIRKKKRQKVTNGNNLSQEMAKISSGEMTRF